MARLPNPGSDDGAWGTILNDFLLQSHAADGTLKPGIVQDDVIVDNTISEAKLGSVVRAKLNTSAGATDLGYSTTTGTVTVTSSSGAPSTLPAATTSSAGVMTAADKTKIDSVASGATANSSNATLLDRANHTGNQAISTVAGLQTMLDGKETAGAVTTHEAASDPHATASYAIMVGGGRRVFVQSTDPGGAASDGDLWIDTA